MNMTPTREGETAAEARSARPGSLLAVAMPPIAGLLLVALFLAAEAAGVSPLSHVEATLSEAAASGSAARVLELIRAGQDPNQPSLIPAGVLDSRAYMVDAIDAAILGRRAEVIPLLREHGAVVADVARSACLANAVDLPEALPMVGAAGPRVARDSSIDVSDVVAACLGETK
jgi:hypothetical protein